MEMAEGVTLVNFWLRIAEENITNAINPEREEFLLHREETYAV